MPVIVVYQCKHCNIEIACQDPAADVKFCVACDALAGQERCPTCGEGVVSIFDHVDGCEAVIL